MIVVDVPTLRKSLTDSGVPEKKAIAIAMGINQAISGSNFVSKSLLVEKIKKVEDKWSQKLYAVIFFSVCLNFLMMYVVLKGEF
ncbi:hypothetical protein G6Z90_15900 [Vibrio aestuarianus subsp. cardii]|uniref:hypothetical protein n=1 Tax=Vibrio aestuarianus TaxID=28171 RepID=UPI0015943E1E|nr:hypothetical protein [Vibrio aestuarianus]MDE1312722.1 hypothetical protein [Vibrio aestuarianus]MDE1312737.1 hypothetical protein [Vibrio aestuarianus]NGZ93955.1 hypothetical protein [Vibrio aestuarianus subsp. cardii]